VVGANLIGLASEALALLCLACIGALVIGGTLFLLDKWRVK
jgi:hypothetical protein